MNHRYLAVCILVAISGLILFLESGLLRYYVSLGHHEQQRRQTEQQVRALEATDSSLIGEPSATTRPQPLRETLSDTLAAPSNGHLIVAGIFVDTSGETLAIVNTLRGVWTKRYAGHQWRCTDVTTNTTFVGRVLDIETHGASAVVSFGRGFLAGTRIRLDNGSRSYGVTILQRSLLQGRRFNLTAALFISRGELEAPDILERWIQYHTTVGVEHFLVYVNTQQAKNLTYIIDLYARFPQRVTFVPFWFNHGVSFGDQQVQNMHALYTMKGVSKWMLSTDVDEYIMCRVGQGSLTQGSLLSLLLTAPVNTNAFQFASYRVGPQGRMKDTPQYRTVLKGKVILNTETCTGHSVHMVTDAIGGRRIKNSKGADRTKGNHRPVHPDTCRLAHFKRRLNATMWVDRIREHLYGT